MRGLQARQQELGPLKVEALPALQQRPQSVPDLIHGDHIGVHLQIPRAGTSAPPLGVNLQIPRDVSATFVGHYQLGNSEVCRAVTVLQGQQQECEGVAKHDGASVMKSDPWGHGEERQHTEHLLQHEPCNEA
jgi:hypothetical protein